jgi:hypothetical protein
VGISIVIFVPVSTSFWAISMKADTLWPGISGLHDSLARLRILRYSAKGGSRNSINSKSG